MAKHRVFLAAPEGTARADFRARVLAELAPPLAAGVERLSVDLVDATPATLPWQRPGEPAAPAEPDFDAVIDLWGSDAALAAALARLTASIPGVPRASVRVAESIEKDELPRAPGRAPGVKFLALMHFCTDLPPAAARRLWTHHAPLALRVHIGMARYVRDWVEQAEASPLATFQGIAELHFPSVEAMATRWFDSEAGRQAIIHDVGHFLAFAKRLYTTEYVLK